MSWCRNSGTTSAPVCWHSRVSVAGSLIEVHRITEITSMGSPVNRGMLCVNVKSPNSVWRRPQRRQHGEQKHPSGGNTVPHTLHHQRAASCALFYPEWEGTGGRQSFLRAGDVGLSRVKSASCHWIAALRCAPPETASWHPETTRSVQTARLYSRSPAFSARLYPPRNTHAHKHTHRHHKARKPHLSASPLLLWCVKVFSPLDREWGLQRRSQICKTAKISHSLIQPLLMFCVHSVHQLKRSLLLCE